MVEALEMLMVCHQHMQVADVDVASNTIVSAKTKTCSEAFDEASCFVEPWACWRPVEDLLRHLQSLVPGQYLLTYVPGSSGIHVLKAYPGLVSPQVMPCSPACLGSLHCHLRFPGKG